MIGKAIVGLALAGLTVTACGPTGSDQSGSQGCSDVRQAIQMMNDGSIALAAASMESAAGESSGDLGDAATTAADWLDAQMYGGSTDDNAAHDAFHRLGELCGN